MKELDFAKGDLERVLRGEKKITIRRWENGEKHGFYADDTVRGVFEGGITVLLRVNGSVKTVMFRDLTSDAAREDGYRNARDLMTKFRKRYYRNLERSDMAVVIRFEVLKVDGVPVAGIRHAAPKPQAAEKR